MRSAKLNDIETVAPHSRDELIDYAFEERKMLIAINAEKILKTPKTLVDIINANIGYPDGVGAVWALEKKGFKEVIKIPGCELWLDIIRKYKGEKSFYFIGGKEEVIQSVIQKLKSDFPQINVSGYRNGYIDDEGINVLISDISSSKPDVVFVAMGSPKQELLMQEMQNAHTALYMGLGGSFDVYTGNVKRAPDWWINNNLEWAYRLVRQPTRIKRQIGLISFFWKLKTGKI